MLRQEPKDQQDRPNYCRKPLLSEVSSTVQLFPYTIESVILAYVAYFMPADSNYTARIAVRSIEIDGLYPIRNYGRRLPRVRIAFVGS